MTEGLTGIAALEAEMRDRLAAKDAEMVKRWQTDREQFAREMAHMMNWEPSRWVMLESFIQRVQRAAIEAEQDWRPIETAPRDGKPVDLWGWDRDPNAKSGIMLPLEADVRRWIDCLWDDDLTELVQVGSLKVYKHLGPQWHFWDGTRRRRIWPTHWRPVPGRPE